MKLEAIGASQKLEAHRLKVDAGMTFYDMAADADSRRAVLNAVVLATLQAYRAEARAEAEFPAHADRLRVGSKRLMTEAWEIAGKVLDEPTRAELNGIIDRWWADNGGGDDGRHQVWYVRFFELTEYSGGTVFVGIGNGLSGAFDRIPLLGTV